MTPEENLDRILGEIRDEPIDPAVVENAAARVWRRLRAPIRSCADFQALMPDYRAGKLSEAQALLLKDHLHECVSCRKASERKVVVWPIPRRQIRSFRYAWAAAGLVAVALTAWGVWNRLGPGGSYAVVESVDGALYRVSGQDVRRVAAGETLPAGAEIRTAKNSGAMVRMRDGSRVEIRERSALSVSETWRDLTLQLGRGGIIVEAAKRRSGHLYVTTRDCRVSVTGTVFSVNSGIKGSRVSVIAGEVLVAQGRDERKLHPGDQLSTNASMQPVPVREDIAWSRNQEAHKALLGALTALQKRLEQAHFPDLRYSSRLLDLLPENTVIFASIPNLNGPLNEAQQVFRERIQDSPELRQWWERSHVDETITKLRGASDYLGDEIVMSAAYSAADHLSPPVFFAELKRSGFRDFVNGLGLWQDVPMLIRSDLVALSPEPAALREFEARFGTFAGTPFYLRIAQAYRHGAGLLFAADLERFAGKPAGLRPHQNGPFPQVKYLMVEQKANGGQTDTRAVLGFQGQRTGVAAWLASPAPMGALDFMSPEAGFATAAVVKTPATIVDQLVEWLQSWHPAFRQELAELESKLGFSIRNDLAGPLGGEFAMALDGPALPTPSWKLAVEVYDPGRLQWAIQKLVEASTHEAAVQLKQEAAGGRTYYTLVMPNAKPIGELHYVFADGYLLAASSRALLDQAIQNRATGYTLPRSTTFTSLLPRDSYANFSAIVYQNIGPTLAPVLDSLNAKQKGISELSREMKPTLVTAYGEQDRITVASTGSLFGLSLTNMGIAQLLGTNQRRRTY